MESLSDKSAPAKWTKHLAESEYFFYARCIDNDNFCHSGINSHMFISAHHAALCDKNCRSVFDQITGNLA